MRSLIRLIRLPLKLSTAPPAYIIRLWQSLNMPRPDSNAHNSALTTILLSLVLLIGLFPGIFHFIWSTPLSLLPFFGSRPTAAPLTMTWFQKGFTLQPRSRGSYLITDQVVQAIPEIREYKVGLLNLFIQHTSCALSLNENCKKSRRISRFPN